MLYSITANLWCHLNVSCVSIWAHCTQQSQQVCLRQRAAYQQGKRSHCTRPIKNKTNIKPKEITVGLAAYQWVQICSVPFKTLAEMHNLLWDLVDMLYYHLQQSSPVQFEPWVRSTAWVHLLTTQPQMTVSLLQLLCFLWHPFVKKHCGVFDAHLLPDKVLSIFKTWLLGFPEVIGAHLTWKSFPFQPPASLSFLWPLCPLHF